MKYRIKIERMDNGNEHVHNITFASDDIGAIISNIRKTIADEIETQQQLSAGYINKKQSHNMINKIVSSSKFDKHAVGKDTTAKAFVENELYD